MKILSVADIHGSQYRLNILLKNIEKYHPDLAVVCGDITQFGPGDVAINFLNQIPIKTLAIPGNIDTSEVNPAISKSKAENINLKKIQISGISFVGIGGENISLNSKILDGEVKKPIDEIINKDTIVVTHVPPYKIQDKVYIGHHIGSKELREIVEKYQPRLVISGHVHENPGMTVFNDTTVVNCSIGKRTEGALIEIDGNINVKILD